MGKQGKWESDVGDCRILSIATQSSAISSSYVLVTMPLGIGRM